MLSLDLAAKLIQAVIALVIARIATRKLDSIDVANFPEELEFLVKKALKALVYLVTFFWILTIFGVKGSFEAFITSLGVSSLAISLALKDTLTDVVNGILLYIDKTFKVGDYIEVSGVKGKVKDIKLRFIVVEQEDGSLAYIRTSKLATSVVIKR